MLVTQLALAVDMTARNVQDAVKAKGLPWSTAKGYDTFCPIGCVESSSTLFFVTPECLLPPSVLFLG